jgi:signal transduction histidine kinase/ActR/RegA family two-component response regulator
MADKAIDRELVTSAAVINALLERPTSGLVAFDRELRVEFSSPELIDVLGPLKHGRPLVAETERAAAVAALIARVRSTGEAVFEVSVGGGASVPLIASCYPINAGGQLVGVGCVLESAARDRDAVELLDATEVAIGVFEGPDHRVRLLNRAWRSRIRISGSIGARLRDVATSTFGDAAFAIMDRVHEAHEPADLHELVLCAEAAGDKHDRRFTGVAAPVRSALGVVRGVMMICAEVTDEVIARRVRLGAPPLVWSGLFGGELDYACPGFTRYARTPMNLGVVHADDRAGCATALSTAVRNLASTDAEARLQCADGSYRWHHVQFSIDEGTRRWYATATDVQDAREAERRARQTAQDDRRMYAGSRDRFLASVSHELRAPITTVLLWEKVLRDAPDDVELRTRGLDAIQQSATTQARLVDDLLDISRATSGKLRVDCRPLDIRRMLVSAIDDEDPAALAKQHRIERSLGNDLGQVSADLGRLRQVMHNLLSNAIKFTDDGGTIRVSARRDGRRVIIEVVDSGRGIAREFLPHIFDPFSQADDTVGRGHDGLGLGLAISYQLVIAHAGQLSVSSPGLGHGTTFQLTLPVVANDELSPHVPASRLSGLHLLVVDDDRRVLDALKAILQSAGATVDIADSVDTGFVALQHTPPDLVLSDLAMPDEDGYSFVGRIRKLDGVASRVPAVAVTGHSTEGDRERAIAAGFDLYVTKPVNVDRLISTIAQLVEARRSGSSY